MQDIKDGMVRTPLAPNSTMIDDPLRALRTVRFACRLGFTLDKTLEETLATTVVRDALAAKVSKERVLTELNGMLLGPDPARALEMLHSFSLLSTVFATPSSGVSLADASHSSLDDSPAIAPWDATWTAAGMALVKRVAALSPWWRQRGAAGCARGGAAIRN
jgi:tRNA nucleotidyltransferase (CCA-adding enzyme)